MLARAGGDGGEPTGLSVDLARAFAAGNGFSLDLRQFPSAGTVVEAVRAGELDLVFLAVDPIRAELLDFSAPYLAIEGAYLVPGSSPLVAIDEVDRRGIRVVVGSGSAYDLHLTRALRMATLVRAPTSGAVVDTLVAGGYEVGAGVRQQLEIDRVRHPELRLLPGRFMRIEQAMATPVGRPAAAERVCAFVEEARAGGLLARLCAAHGVVGATLDAV